MEGTPRFGTHSPDTTGRVFQFPDSLTKAKKEDLLRPVDIFLVEYNFATDGSLCARQSWANYLDKESFDRIEPYLQDSIVLHWNGKRFK